MNDPGALKVSICFSVQPVAVFTFAMFRGDLWVFDYNKVRPHSSLGYPTPR